MITSLLTLALSLGISLSEFRFDKSIYQDMLDDIVEGFNDVFEQYGMDTFKTSRLERYIKIDDLDNGGELTLLDICGDNGYVLINDDHEILSYRIDGSCERVFENRIGYSHIEGAFRDADGLVQLQKGKDSSEFSALADDDERPVVPYAGVMDMLEEQYMPGPWVQGAGYRLSGLSEPSSESYTTSNQKVFSRYDASGRERGENNCSLVAVANGFAYLSEHQSYQALPHYNDTITFYAGDWNTYLHDSVIPNYTFKTVSSIYYTVMTNAFDLEYDGDGFYRSKIHRLVNNSAYDFGYNGSSVSISYSFSKTTIINAVQQSKPIYLSVDGDSCYTNHGVMITGCKDFLKPMEIATFLYVWDVFCVSVYDGWQQEEVWIDMASFQTFGDSYRRNNQEGIVIMEVE